MNHQPFTLLFLGLLVTAMGSAGPLETPGLFTPVDDGVPGAAATVEGVRVGGDVRWRYGLLGAKLRYPRDQFNKQRTRLWVETDVDPTTSVRIGVLDDPTTDLKLDEGFARRKLSCATVTVGRQYFILGPLGLLVNNSLEAISALRVEGQVQDWKWLGVAGNLEGNDGFLAVRGETSFPNGLAGVNLLQTGRDDEAGQSIDAVWNGLQGRWSAEVAHVSESGDRNENGWAWLIGYEQDLDEQLTVGGFVGQVESGYRTFYSSLTHPYLGDGVSPFDRPLFLDPDHVASGVELLVRYRLPHDSTARLRWYDGEGRGGGKGHGAVALSYTRPWDERTVTSAVLGYQGVGGLPDLWMLRGEATIRF